MEEDKRDLISREISKFRDTHKVKNVSFVLLDFSITGLWTEGAHVVHSLDRARLAQTFAKALSVWH